MKHFLALMVLCSPAHAEVFMHVKGTLQPPVGYVAYCEEHKTLCQPKGTDKRFVATARDLTELDIVNRFVNSKIIPASDKDVYGVDEYWTIPTKQGDCEDYALLKQQILISMGWPTSALLLTVVYDNQGRPHAVLTARTTQGDLVLDNQNNELKPWHQVPYRFVSRQSTTDPKIWYSLDQ